MDKMIHINWHGYRAFKGLLMLLMVLLTSNYAMAQTQDPTGTDDVLNYQPKSEHGNYHIQQEQKTADASIRYYKSLDEDAYFDDRFFISGFNGNILSAFVHNDELYIGGWFGTFNNTILNGIAKWDGSSWQSLGEGFNTNGRSATVWDITAYEDDLIAAGFFNYSGETEILSIARWNGSEWQPMNGGLNGSVEALAVYNGDLIAGGSFTSDGNGENEFYNIAKWDGTNWVQENELFGLNGTVTTLEVVDDNLLVGGEFSKHLVSTNNNFTGSYTITQLDTSESAGGYFSNGWLFNDSREFEAELVPDGFSVQNRKFTARPLNQSDQEITLQFGDEAEDSTVTIESMGTGLSCGNGISYGPAIEVTGEYDAEDDSEFIFVINENEREDCELPAQEIRFMATKNTVEKRAKSISFSEGEENNEVNNIALWDGSQWQALDEGFNAPVRSITNYDNQIIAAGFFTHSGENEVNHIAQWNGEEWLAVGNGFNNNVHNVFTGLEGLVAAGNFNESNGNSMNRIALWDGNEWSDAGEALEQTSAVFTAIPYDDQILAITGNYSTGRGLTVSTTDGIVSDNLGTVVPGGMGTNFQAAAIYVDDGTIYSGGNFSKAGDVAANRVAQWTEESGWQPMGEGFNNFVRKLFVFDGDPIAGGDFTHSGETEVNFIARWDGTEWQPMDGGFNGNVQRFTEYEGELYVGGTFRRSDSNDYEGIARWDGEQWQEVGEGLEGNVRDFTIYENKLVLGGGLLGLDDGFSADIAMWDGSSWEIINSDGMGEGAGSVTALEVYNDELYAAFDFPVNGIAKWNGNNWDQIGGNFNNVILDLQVHEGRLYAGGFYSIVGESPIGALAVLNEDGDMWENVKGSTNGVINSLFSAPEGLYFGGGFEIAGDLPSNNIGYLVTGAQEPIAPPEPQGNEHILKGEYHIIGYDEEIFSVEAVFDGTGAGTAYEIDDPEDEIPLQYSVADDGRLSLLVEDDERYTGIISPNGNGFTLVTDIDFESTILTAFKKSSGATESLLEGRYNITGYDEYQSWNFTAEMILEENGSGSLDFIYSSSDEIPDEKLDIEFKVDEDGYFEIGPPDSTDSAFEGFIHPDGSGFILAGGFEGESSTILIGDKTEDNAANDLLEGTYLIAGYDECGVTLLKFVFDGAESGEISTLYANCSDYDLEEDLTFDYSVMANGRLSITFNVEGESETELTGMISTDGKRVSLVETHEEEGWNIFTGYKSEGFSTSNEDDPLKPADFHLAQNYPNPFNPSTVISYHLAENSKVKLQVFDMLGRNVATLINERKSAGKYNVQFDASALSSGMYIYRIQAGDFVETRKMMLIK